MDIYNPNLIEKKWQDFWDKNKTFKTKADYGKKKLHLMNSYLK